MQFQFFLFRRLKARHLVIELQNVSFNINENGLKKDILKDVSLKFESGKITAITGQNGSGKSTLLKIMIRLRKKYIVSFITFVYKIL